VAHMPKLRPNVWRSICAVVGEFQCQRIRIQPTLTTRLLPSTVSAYRCRSALHSALRHYRVWRRAAMLNAKTRVRLPRNCGRCQPLTFAIPRPHIADNRVAAVMNMDMLDSDVLPRAVPKAPQELHLNCESLQQAASRRS
jgi:hypothetical protein